MRERPGRAPEHRRESAEVLKLPSHGQYIASVPYDYFVRLKESVSSVQLPSNVSASAAAIGNDVNILCNLCTKLRVGGENGNILDTESSLLHKEFSYEVLH